MIKTKFSENQTIHIMYSNFKRFCKYKGRNIYYTFCTFFLHSSFNPGIHSFDTELGRLVQKNTQVLNLTHLSHYQKTAEVYY